MMKTYHLRELLWRDFLLVFVPKKSLEMWSKTNRITNDKFVKSWNEIMDVFVRHFWRPTTMVQHTKVIKSQTAAMGAQQTWLESALVRNAMHGNFWTVWLQPQHFEITRRKLKSWNRKQELFHVWQKSVWFLCFPHTAFFALTCNDKQQKRQNSFLPSVTQKQMFSHFWEHYNWETEQPRTTWRSIAV